MRFEADVDLHFQGDGETAYGVKYVLTAVRSEHVHGRIILDVEWVAEKGGEAKGATDSFRKRAPVLPGGQGVIYDTALRGVHHHQLLRELGWLSVNKVQAKELIKRDGDVKRRVEKTVHIEDKVVNGKTVHLYARAGAVGVSELDDKGEPTFVELKRLKTHRKHDKAGTYRWYNEYLLPEGGTVVVRLDTTDEDRARKLNRSENVRPIPPSDPDFKRIYNRRNDAESINRALDDSMWLGRAHSKGHERQLVNMLGYALMVNGLALLQHRQRQRLKEAA